jgi:hypothetical protein
VSVAAPQAAAEHSVPHSTAQELNRSTVPLSVGVVGRGSELKFTVAGSQPEPVAAEEVADTAENTVESAVEAAEAKRGPSESRTNVSVEVKAAPAKVERAPAIEVRASSVREPGRGEVVSHEAAHAEVANDDDPTAGVSSLAPLRINLSEQQAPDQVTIKFALPELGNTAQQPAEPNRVIAKKRGITPTVIAPVEAVRPADAGQQPQVSEAPARSGDKREVVSRVRTKREAAPIEAAPEATLKSEPTLAKTPVAEHVPVDEVTAAQPKQGEPTLADPAREKQHVTKPEPTPTPAIVKHQPLQPSPVEIVTAPVRTAPITAESTLAKPEPVAEAIPAPKDVESAGQEPQVAKLEPAPTKRGPRVAQQPPVAVAEPSRSESAKLGNSKRDVAHEDAPERPIAPPLASPRGLAGNDSTAERSARLMADVSRADHRIAHGFELAERGAIYLAKAEFTAALKLIAQAKDIEDGTRAHGKAVTAGLVALKESGDFVRQIAGIDDVDLPRIVSGHKTPVLKGVDVSEMAPTVAAQYYYAFAQDELARGISGEMVGSMAMYGLGKATLVVAGANAHQMEYTGQAMAFYQAAMAVEPRNVRAANELGVLLANNGELNQARDMLTRSASLAPNAETWQNLAAVHSRMGDRKTADQLKQQASSMKKVGRGAGPAVRWVDPVTFADIAPATDGTAQLPVSATAKETPSVKPGATPTNPPSSVAQRINEWLPQPLRR